MNTSSIISIFFNIWLYVANMQVISYWTRMNTSRIKHIVYVEK